MRFLMKRNQYSKTMKCVEAPYEWWDSILSNPPVIERKDKCPLAIFGTPVSAPELDEGSRNPRCTGPNVDSIYALALDYDNGMTIREFIEEYNGVRFSLYTSYSYGVKYGDRFRVVIPLAKELPCHLLESRRVRKALEFQWPGVDESCFHRGHWQILPARNPAGNYMFHKNAGKPWDFDLEGFERMKAEEEAEFEKRRAEAMASMDEGTQDRVLHWMQQALPNVERGCGTSYTKVKSLLSWGMHNGLGDAVYLLENPWPADDKWVKRWPGLIRWASTLC